MHEGETVDLVYNRLVDFSFERPENAALRSAYDRGLAVVTPNPHNHALFADKRNLTILSDPLELREMGVTPSNGAALGFIPRTVMVTAENAAELWSRRKTLFFKPTRGHGSKAVYRGDKLTRGVGTTSARVVMSRRTSPPRRSASFTSTGGEETRKMDVRLYTYDGAVLVAAARLYQGQATNFRTRAAASHPSSRCDRRVSVSGCSRSR